MSSFRDDPHVKANVRPRLPLDAPILAGSTDLADCLFGWTTADDKTRKPFKFSIFTEAGNVKVCIRDEFGNRQSFHVLDPAKNISEALAEVLEADCFEWRPMSRNR